MADESKAGTEASLPGGEKADPATVFAALAEIIYQGSDVNEMYAAICVAATLTVRGCDHASLLILDNGRYVTVGASDGLARKIDELELRAGDGPCLDAIEEETPQIDADLTTAPHWPKFAAMLLEETPVRGAMGFRLLVNNRKGAALNLFSDTPNSFDAESAGRAAVLASFASVAINAVAKGEDAASLRRGLLSNREIGKAVGMLMLLHDLTEEEAFDLLRRHSQALNIKLADVAREVIERRGSLPSNGEQQLPPGT
ncbi:GAF and ANTAR domain-containing protein [Mycobacterium sp. Aquia_216]|uniref:GAF and ANTAR domain-containing protein n=1 Tax=Mycobacterium sp. Aquia_216 TaxID=2991729 RepID=UPI002279F42D|nr:GAF and ANTAR domain-containing protein [Mycobacterium sp. Aquia_216]WAJ46873.1 GAF and ANTAR domain-containing protein [Mycobacterium sp. Aquia_216]